MPGRWTDSTNRGTRAVMMEQAAPGAAPSSSEDPWCDLGDVAEMLKSVPATRSPEAIGRLRHGMAAGVGRHTVEQPTPCPRRLRRARGRLYARRGADLACLGKKDMGRDLASHILAGRVEE